MGITEDRDQKQIYFCAFCNGPGVIHLEHGTRLCTPCHNWYVRGGFHQKIEEDYGCRVRKKFKKITPTERRRDRLYREQRKLCYYCCLEIPFDKWTIEHKQPISKGGKRNISNEVGACRYCNGIKGNLTEAEFRASSRFPNRASNRVSFSASSPAPQPSANHS